MSANDCINLSGCWEFELDSGSDKPQEESHFPNQIFLPGSTDEGGYGEKTEKPIRWYLNRKYQYVGAAWYAKEISIPEEWERKRITLFLERCHWETTVWVDGREIGSQDSLCAPHVYDLTCAMTCGTHRLVIRVDNRIKYSVGLLAHSVTEHTQSNWNGIIGKLELRAEDPVFISDMQIYPNLSEKSATVKMAVRNCSGQPVRGEIFLLVKGSCGQASGETIKKEFFCNGDSAKVEIKYPMGDSVQLWDEFTPQVYRMAARMEATSRNDWYNSERDVLFGMREFKTAGTNFMINGRRTFLRGTLECCIFPQTGYPAACVAQWRRIFHQAKQYGFNHFRFHSWCPPEEAFEAADREGFMLQVETPVWTKLGSMPDVDLFVRKEGARILKYYGNHPSFCMMAVGNEPSGNNRDAFLSETVTEWRNMDSRHIYTSCSGWPALPTNDYHTLKNGNSVLRCQDWLDELNGRLNAKPLSTDYDYSEALAGFDKPVVAHEVGQWCAFPDFSFIGKLNGALAPRNFTLFRDSIKKKGLLPLARDFLQASGKLQVLEYKEDVETALRTHGSGGFQLLSAEDFPGQGSALVGFLDSLWESKGYTNEEQFSSFCCETVPLARIKKMTWTSDEDFEASLEIANFGAHPFEDASVGWALKYEHGGRISTGCFSHLEIPVDNSVPIGKIKVPLKGLKLPAKLVLEVSVCGTKYHNSWNVWAYPATVDTSVPEGITVCRNAADAEKALKRGEKVLYFVGKDEIKNTIPLGFTTVFWNYEFTNHQAPRTMGVLCNPNDPCLHDFVTDYYTNWQWFDLIKNAKPMILDSIQRKVEPIIRVIDDWNTNNSLGLLFEAKVGSGSLLVCSIDLFDHLEARPVARQLLYSILNYMDGKSFDPSASLDGEEIERMLETTEDHCPDSFDFQSLFPPD